MAKLYLAAVWALPAWLLSARASADEKTDFFEQKIRPLLSESCYECHSEKKQKGGLRLDTKAGWEKGGDSGPAVVPGDPEKSLLIQAVRYHDKDLAMPPEKSGGKIPDERIGELEAWVKLGAPDPRTGAPPAPARDMDGARQHWSFKPVVAPAIPAVQRAGWVRTPVDAFVLAGLEAKGLQPAPKADKRTLIRRLYLDLTGLPPTPAAVAAFAAEKDPRAYAKIVDQLLASPQYGERYGRFWLDIARYADTRGYLAGGEERRFPFSYTYRDYVIRAFNEDKPFDLFLCEQMAADRLVSGDDQSALAAMGLLTLGRTGTTQEIADDRIDVVTRGLMGLTVTCARCHDHKFDPIPTADYYSLYSVFASSVEPQEKPLLSKKIKTGPEYDAFLKAHAELEAKVEAKQRDVVESFLSINRQNLGSYLLAAHDAEKAGLKGKLGTFAGERKLADPILERWMDAVQKPEVRSDPIVSAWFEFEALGEENFAARAEELAKKIAANDDPAHPRHPLIAKAFTDASPDSLKEVADLYDNVSSLVEEATNPNAVKSLPPKTNKKSKNAAAQEKAYEERVAKRAETALSPTADEVSFHAALLDPKSPAALPRPQVEQALSRQYRESTVELRKQIGELEWSHPGAPTRAMAMEDRDHPVNQRIFVRGSADNQGDPVPRRFLEVLSGPERQPFTNGSGRLDLAKAIASRDNPLTARVFVNRLWSWHFGRPFVSTPGDFGVRTEAPAQQPLLDWLAASFMDEGWSVKKVQRLILLSSAYQQSSDAAPKAEQADPENLLIHRFNRHRLDFEAMRDTLLASSGKLDLTVGGFPVELWNEPYPTRRTVYGFIDRLNLPAVFRTFDFANPDISSPMRFSTIVPQQALFMMNSPFVIEQSRALLHRPEIEKAGDNQSRLTAIYQVLLQRAPTADELADGDNFLARFVNPPPIQSGWHYGYGWWDPLAGHVKDFHQFKAITKDRRSPENMVPSNQFGFAQITPNGGHPGTMLQTSTILRWVAPVEGKVDIEGTLKQADPIGDGVHGRIISSTGGQLGEWSVHHGQVSTSFDAVPVKVNESIDFIVECGKSDTGDTYSWIPRISYIGASDPPLDKRSWDASADFAPTRRLAPLNAWETLSQAMLVCNEMMYIE